MKRFVQPEILDSLPQDHPAAAANRRDIRLLNGIMGNYRWFCRHLVALLTPNDRILEIGAGTGELGLCLREAAGRKLPHYCGLDLWSRPAQWPPEWEWEQQNLLHFDRYHDFTVLIANLILHQFDDRDLDRLRPKLTSSGIRLILANEPARRKLHQWQLMLLRPLNLHPVSRHDGHVSVEGGFCHNELATRLGLVQPRWDVHCHSGFLGWNRLIATRWEGDAD